MADSRICSVAACGKPATARGWCKVHYYRWKRNGDPVAGRAAPGALRDWLQRHTNFSGIECLIWPFGINSSGYGVVLFEGKRTTASRIMCFLAHGEPEDDRMEAAHSCGKGHEGCVNPKHLRWATHSDNQADRIGHGTSNRGENNGFAKLSDSDVLAIRAMAGELPQKEVAEMFGIAPCHVSKIQNGETRSWLGGDEC